jgi:glycosyltransferase involved in cell wall biosynthesis
MRYVLFGDGESPHLLKWARALADVPGLELWAASSRGFMAGFDAVLPASRRLSLATRPRVQGGNVGLLTKLPALLRWLQRVQPRWLHAHYLSSHGTLAWLALKAPGLRGTGLVASAWGSDILVAPARSALLRAATRRVLRAAVLATSDSQAMAERMRQLGAGEVMVFPFGLEAMPAAPASKDDLLWFANRALEPLYAPHRVLALFAAAAPADARLVVAHDGSLRPALEARAHEMGLAARVRFVGRLEADVQARWYAQARWYLSLPESDSVAVSVLEAMAHGCIPVLSDLPANRELVRPGENGLLVAGDAVPAAAEWRALAARSDAVAAANRRWVEAHALFAPAVQRFLARLRVSA